MVMEPGDCKILEVTRGSGKVRVVFSQYNGPGQLNTTKEVTMTNTTWRELSGRVDPDH